MSEINYVIGSGPTGVAAAKALLDNGQSVVMLDAGLSLEDSRQAVLDRTVSTPANEWDKVALESFKEGTRATAKGFLLKLAYGSDFPYREAEQFIKTTEHVRIVPSLARGGLSNVWGAAMLPYLEEDTADWPINMAELGPHYRAVLRLTGLAGRRDDLSRNFPLFVEPHETLPTGALIKSLLEDMGRSRERLNDRGIFFGSSRLAVAEKNQHGIACAACRMCMYGCPLRLIYNSADTLNSLARNFNFEYRSNVIVKTFTERADSVEIQAYDRIKKADISFLAMRLFIAAGIVSTTRLVLESMGAINKVVMLKDSQYFLLPLLRYSVPPSFDADEPAHTLPQAFIEIFDESVSETSVHLQVYGYNDLYHLAIKNALGPMYAVSRPIVSSFLKRFVLILGYLHSEYSHEIEARLLPLENCALTGRLAMEVRHNPKTKETMKRLIRKLSSVKGLLRAVPLSPLLKMGKPSGGFHTGGSFPMKREPKELETDTLGKLYGHERVHIVDSSVFPSIPASTITLTAMANAHRIASELSRS